MSTPLKEGENYHFFPKSYYTGGKVTGVTNAEVMAFCTKNYIFVIPKKDFTHFVVAMRQRSYDYFGEGVKPEEGVRNMIAEDGMTVEEMERRLCDMLDTSNTDRVIKVSDLKSFKTIILGPASLARMKHSAGGGIKVLSCKGKGNMKRFKEFYAVKV